MSLFKSLTGLLGHYKKSHKKLKKLGRTRKRRFKGDL